MLAFGEDGVMGVVKDHFVIPVGSKTTAREVISALGWDSSIQKQLFFLAGLFLRS